VTGSPAMDVFVQAAALRREGRPFAQQFQVQM